VIVQTVLGPLDVPDAVPPGRASEVYASAVRLCARDMPGIVGKLPNELRSAGRILARSSCGDRLSTVALRAIDLGDTAALVTLQTQIPDLRESPPQARDEAYFLMGGDLRAPAGRLARAVRLIAQGRIDEAQNMTASAWASRIGNGPTAPVASVGALRAHTGCTCPDILSSGVCTCGAM
jgi:hypothetical protein